jgi:glycosyltransferase involved in cell wall biosynthesis
LYLLLKGRIKKSASYGPESFLTELKVIKKEISSRSNIVHLLYVERMLGLLGKIPRSLTGTMVGTVHQPVSLWLGGRHDPEMVKPLEALIVLSHEKKLFFEAVLPGKVHFIRHGVDTEFFSPAMHQESTPTRQRPRCIFSGVWLRDIETLYGIVKKVLQRNPGIHFDLLVPEDRRGEQYFDRLAGFAQVRWHAGLTDEQLRDLYRSATLLLLPLKDCTANNALLEGVACGLPVVSNDIGGMPDYTEPEFADLFPVGDVEGMASAVLKIIDDSAMQKERGLKARAFAENYLDWRHIANSIMQVYSRFLS